MPIRMFMIALMLACGVGRADVIETRDGKHLEGAVRFADGFVFIRGDSDSAKLQLDQIKSLRRDNPAAAVPAPNQPLAPSGVLIECFADGKWEKSCAVLPAANASNNWDSSPPNPYTPRDFTARITGFITPRKTGEYRFSTSADDFASMTVADKQINGDSPPIPLQAGKPVPFSIDYRDDAQQGSLTVKWTPPGEPARVIPADAYTPPPDAEQRIDAFYQKAIPDSGGGLRGEYFEDADFKKRKVVRLDPDLSMKWPGRSEVEPGFGAKEFAARWIGKFKAPRTGKFTFEFSTGTGYPARLWIDNKILIDAWNTAKESDPRKGEIDMNEGQLYDLRVEFATGKGAREMQLLWQRPDGKTESIPSSALFPPDGVPQARIITPSSGDAIDAVNGVGVEVVVTQARGTIKKIELFAKGNNTPLAEMTRPPYRTVIHHDKLGATELTAQITHSTGLIARSEPVKFNIVSAPSSLGGDWNLARVGDAAAPSAQQEGERLLITATSGSLGQNLDLPLVFQSHAGNVEIIARLLELRSEKPQSTPLAGLTIRTDTDPGSPHLTLLASTQAGWIVGLEHSTGRVLYTDQPFVLPVWMRLNADNGVARAQWSSDGQIWNAAGSISLGDHQPLMLGLTAFSLGSREAITAVFDNVSIRAGLNRELAGATGLQLTDGSVIEGQFSLDANQITLRTADGKPRAFPRNQVARLFYAPLADDTAAAIPAGWNGVVVGNDLLEGDLSDVSDKGVTVNSILFGIRRLTPDNGLVAVILNDPRPNPKATLIQHTTGRLLTTNIRLEADHLLASTPALGEIRLSSDQILSIQSP